MGLNKILAIESLTYTADREFGIIPFTNLSKIRSWSAPDPNPSVINAKAEFTVVLADFQHDLTLWICMFDMLSTRLQDMFNFSSSARSSRQYYPAALP